MKISLFVHSLGDNPIVRAKPVADGLELLGHEVEVLGLLIDRKEVYHPYRDCYNYKALRCSSYTRDVLIKGKELAKLATGEAAYAFKPLLTSFYPALLYSGFGKNLPLYLDVEDDDVFAQNIGLGDGIRKNLRELNKANGVWPSRFLHRFLRRCTGVTVSSTKLRSIYGGEIVLHGPKVNSSICEIGSDRQLELRRRYELPDNKIVLLFAGKARLHKGFGLLEEIAGESFFRESFHIALAGNPDQDLFKTLKKSAGNSCSILGMIPHNEIHQLVLAADLVPVIQVKEPYAESQIPAKMLEAMACGRPCLVTDVGDLPSIAGITKPGNERGWLVKDGSRRNLEGVLGEFAGDLNVARKALRKRGRAALEFHRQNSSIEAISRRLEAIAGFGLNGENNQQACVNIDDVLCRDPTDEEKDDGSA